MGIEKFKANFQGGYRPNKFKVIVPVLGEKCEFVCKGAQLLGRTIGQTDTKYQGHPVGYKGDPTFEELTLTIMLDEDFAVWNQLNGWMIAMDVVSGDVASTLNPAQYKQTGVIIILDGNEEEIHSDTIIGMFPTALQPLDLNWETSDTIAEYTVTFKYDYHVPTTLEIPSL